MLASWTGFTRVSKSTGEKDRKVNWFFLVQASPPSLSFCFLFQYLRISFSLHFPPSTNVLPFYNGFAKTHAHVFKFRFAVFHCKCFRRQICCVLYFYCVFCFFFQKGPSLLAPAKIMPGVFLNFSEYNIRLIFAKYFNFLTTCVASANSVLLTPWIYDSIEMKTRGGDVNKQWNTIWNNVNKVAAAWIKFIFIFNILQGVGFMLQLQNGSHGDERTNECGELWFEPWQNEMMKA